MLIGSISTIYGGVQKNKLPSCFVSVVLLWVFYFAVCFTKAIAFYCYACRARVFGVAFLACKKLQLVARFFLIKVLAFGEYLHDFILFQSKAD